MRAHAAAFLSDVEARPDSPEAGVAHRAAGCTCWFAGEYVEARDHLERALALFQPGRDADLTFRFGQDPGVAAMAYLAIASWPIGEVDRAISLIDTMQTRVAGLTQVATLVFGRALAALFELTRRDRARAAPNAFELARIAREHDLPMHRALGVFLEGWATAASGAPGGGLEDMRRGVDLMREQNYVLLDGLLKIALADAEARAGDPARAIAILDEALATCDRLGSRAFEAELHRARGEILLERDPANSAPAEGALLTAIAVAKRQGTRSFGLRAALPLAKLYRSTGRPVDAHAVLAPALEGFAPTPEMPEIAEAQALLAALGESDGAKAAIAQRKHRLHLQTTLAHAVMWSKGFAAKETEAALAHAGVLASRSGDFSERLAAAHGQWTLLIARGELRAARELASSMLREAEDGGHRMEASIARRGLALIYSLTGEFLEARSQCERALADRDPKRDQEVRERFGDDLGTVVISILAVTAWQLGEVDRARELIDAATRRAAELGHGVSNANPLYCRALLEMQRGDAAAALTSAEGLEALGREQGMPFWLVGGECLSGWARGRLGDPVIGAAKLQRALTSLANQGVSVSLRLYQGLLAEIEAEASGVESALARIDEALTNADQVEYRFDLPFIHRLQGDLRLKRNPPDPASAEESYRTAIAIAKGQGARSYELLASLALAKLYHSTGRPADASAALRPRSKVLRLRRKCPRSPRPRRCWRLWRSRMRSGPTSSRDSR